MYKFSFAVSVCAFCYCICWVTAQDNRPPDRNNHFIYPPLPGPQYSNDPTVFYTNLNFTVGETQSAPFKWVTNLESHYISLNQEGAPGIAQYRPLTDCIPGLADSNILYWDGEIDPIDLKDGAQAYLAAWDCNDPDATPIFFSHYINLTEPVIVSSSSSSSTPSRTRTSINSATGPARTDGNTNPNGAASPASSAAASPASSNGSSDSSAALGGGIGGGIGGAIVLVALLFAFWKYRQHHKAKQQQPYPGGATQMGPNASQYSGSQAPHYAAHYGDGRDPSPPYAEAYGNHPKYQQQSWPAELPPGSQPSEMSAHNSSGFGGR